MVPALEERAMALEEPGPYVFYPTIRETGIGKNKLLR